MRITSVVPPAMGRASSPCLTKRSLVSASDCGCKRSNYRMVMVRLERNGFSLLNALCPRSQVCTVVDRLLTDGASFEQNRPGKRRVTIMLPKLRHIAVMTKTWDRMARFDQNMFGKNYI